MGLLIPIASVLECSLARVPMWPTWMGEGLGSWQYVMPHLQTSNSVFGLILLQEEGIVLFFVAVLLLGFLMTAQIDRIFSPDGESDTQHQNRMPLYASAIGSLYSMLILANLDHPFLTVDTPLDTCAVWLALGMLCMAIRPSKVSGANNTVMAI